MASPKPLDMAVSKLLANSDLRHDSAVDSRDTIDLAMMAPPKAPLRQTVAKAQAACGDRIEADLVKVIEALRARPHRQARRMSALRMTTVSNAVLWSRINALEAARRLLGLHAQPVHAFFARTALMRLRGLGAAEPHKAHA